MAPLGRRHLQREVNPNHPFDPCIPLIPNLINSGAEW
jgi:hypothetical protein